MMPNLLAIRVKANAGWCCQECPSMELVQSHHIIPGDDSSCIALCAECHSKKHPNIPKALFFSRNHQPYWYNRPAASIARSLGVHSRTIIRAARRLEIKRGELSSQDEALIRDILTRPRRHEPEKAVSIPTSTKMLPIEFKDFVGIVDAAAKIGVSRVTLWRWLKKGEVQYFIIGSARMIPLSEVERLSNKNKQAATEITA